MSPNEALPAHEARALAALIRVYARDGRATVRTVAREDGRVFSTVHYMLCKLRKRGLVAWTDGEHGTILPRLWPVAA